MQNAVGAHGFRARLVKTVDGNGATGSKSIAGGRRAPRQKHVVRCRNLTPEGWLREG